MNKKLAVIAVFCAFLMVFGGLAPTMLYGTEYMQSKSKYSYAVSSAAIWWNCSWAYCKKITIDHTKIESDQTNFPVLLNETADADLAAHAQTDGDDIVFVNMYNTTQYSHEIEEYDSSTGALSAWVKVTSLSSTQDTILYMYYGNPTCSNQQDITSVWDDNFIMVHHLNESSMSPLDSTSNDNDGTNNGATYNSSSKITGGYDFDGNDNVSAGNDNSLNITSAITLEGWVKDPPWSNIDTETEVKIVDKREEERIIFPGKPFSVERTISTNKKTELTFVALYSPGIALEDMFIDKDSIFKNIYSKDKPGSDQEYRIEDIRKQLPDKLKELEIIGYSKPFTLDGEKTIKMKFDTYQFNKLNTDGRISYLIISDDGTYDYESTTHLETIFDTINWRNKSPLFDMLYNIRNMIRNMQFNIENESVQTQIDRNLENDTPVILFFYENSCNKCQEEEKELIDIKEKYEGEIAFIYVHKNTDPELIGDFNIKEYPTIFLIADKNESGYIYKIFSDYVSGETLSTNFDEILNDDTDFSSSQSWFFGQIEIHKPLDLPSEVASQIFNGGKSQIIIKFKDKEDFEDKKSLLEEFGFVKKAEVSSEGIIAGVLDSFVYENIKYNKDISFISEDDKFSVLLDESLPLINFDDAFNEFGLTGDGKKICIIDTGVDGSLVDYSYGYDFVNDDPIPDDEHGHGTKVAAVIKSMAPDAELIVAKVIGANGVGYESTVLEALEWCIAQNPDVISFSIGSEGSCNGFCDTNFVAGMSNDAVDIGIFVVAAAGNDGLSNLKSPACGSNVFSVGATDDNDDIASFSNVNPTLDMFAPGVDIETFAGGGSGTSFSAPFVAGASLLVLENEYLGPVDLKYRLRSTGKPINYTYNETISLDIPRLDIYNALSNNKTMEPYGYSWWWQGILIDGEIYEPLATVNLLPNADGTTQDWDAFSGERQFHWECVDDPVGSPDDLDYVYTATVNEFEDFNHETSALLTGATISNVRVNARLKEVGSGAINIGLKNARGTRAGAAADTSLTSSWTNYYKDWPYNPWAGIPFTLWTKADIDDLQTSLKSSSFGGRGDSVYCSQIYLTVTYNTAPTITSWNADTETGATEGWDWDNNDLQVDWNVNDADHDNLNLIWTFSKGGTPSDPTLASWNGRIAVTSGGEPGYTETNQDLDWASGDWSDYRGTVNFKLRLHDGTNYSTTIVTDSLSGGIDGTDPETKIMNQPDAGDGPDSIWGNATDTTCYVDHVDMYIKNTTDSTYWTGSTWSTETWLSASANDSSFDSASENWNYDSSGITWGYKSYEIKANTSDESGRDDSSPATDTFTIIDDVPPSINFTEPPTPQNNTETQDTYAVINVTVSDNCDYRNLSSFIDWNQSLRGYWSMDYTNPTHVFDNSSYVNNASFNGGLSQSDITTGIYGDALEFDGVDDNLSVLDHSSLDITSAITIEAWVKDPPLIPSNNAPRNELIKVDEKIVDIPNSKTISYNWFKNSFLKNIIDLSKFEKIQHDELTDVSNKQQLKPSVEEESEETRSEVPHGFFVAGTEPDTSSSNFNSHHGDSFGIKNVKAVNSSHFWNDFYLPHSTWQLEVQHPVTLEWLDEWEGTNLSTWLDIDRDRSEDNSSEKITLNITNNHPTQALKFRLKFGIDAQVKNYVNRSSWYEYELTYTANETENYTVFFNYSDIKPLIQNETLYPQHGIKNIDGKDVFGFMLTVNQTLGAGESLSIDPTFGYSSGSTTAVIWSSGLGFEYVYGVYDTCGSNGEADKITVKFGTIGGAHAAWCAIYEDDGSFDVGNLVANGETDTAMVSGAGEVDFPFSGTKPQLTSGTSYFLMVAYNGNVFGLSDNYIIHDNGAGDDHGVRDADQFINDWDNYDPYTGESASNTDYWIYCTYTEASNNAPTQSNPGPADSSANQAINSALNVTCSDNDGDTMNATWWYNESNSWWKFAYNNTISNNSNIIQTNTGNFSNYSSTYYWSVNLTDGEGGWSNETYHFTTQPTPKTILAKGDAYELSINGTSPMILCGYLDDTLIVNTSIDESWHHVAFTYDGTTAKLYVDGNLNDTNYTYSDPITTNDNILEIGSNLTGELDELRLWSRALSWEEINVSYNASSIPQYEHNFSGLSIDNYSYYAYAIDTAGNHNSTETRYFNVTSAPPENDAPYATNVQVHAAKDFTLDNLTGTYTYNDNETDAETGSTLEWYESSDNITWTALSVNDPWLDSNNTNESWYYKFEVTPRNAEGTGNASNSSVFEITSLNESAGTYSWKYDEAGNLTIGSGGSLTISGTVDIDGNTTIEHGGSIDFGDDNHEIGSLSVDSTSSCTGTSETIFITSENTSSTYAINLDGTYTNSSGMIQINTTSATEVDLVATGDVYDLNINAGSTVDWNGNAMIGNNLNVTSGTFQPNSASDTITVTNNATINGGTLGGNTASGYWLFKSLYQTSGTIDATKGNIYITGEINNFAIDLTGTFTNNSGVVQINTTAATEADLSPTSGTIANLNINAGSTVDWNGTTNIGNNLNLTSGTFQPNSASDTLTVTNNATVKGGTLGGNSASGYWELESLYQSSGTITATTGTIYIIGENNDYAIDLDGTYTNNSGLIQINTTAATEADLAATGDIFDLTINSGSTVDWDGNTMIGDDLTISSGTFRPKSASNTLDVTDDVTISGGTLGGNSASGTWTLGTLTESSGTITATTGSIIITSETAGGYAVDLDGTYTANTGTIEINTNADTNIDIGATGDLYKLIVDTSDYTVTSDAAATVSNNLTIQAGQLEITDSLTVAEMDINNGGEFEIKSDSAFTMTGLLYQNGFFNITSGNATDVNLSVTKFDLNNASQIGLYDTPSDPSDPSGWTNINHYVNLTEIDSTASVDINITYFDSDLGSVTESTLVMKEYNWTADTWSAISDTGVNTAANYVWGNSVTDFSIFGPFGQEPSPNNAPAQSNEIPTNNSLHIPTTNTTINCTITDQDDGDTMSWTIHSEIGSNSGSGASNGSISASIAGNLTAGSTYTWYVNVSDGTDWTNATYTFTVNNPVVLSNEIPTNQSGNVPLTNTTINCTITDADTGDTMNWTIESTIGSNSSNNNQSGDSIFASISGNLSSGTTYTWYVNVSDGYEYTRAIYTFNTTNNPPVLSNEIPTNQSQHVPTTNSTLNCTVTDADNDSITWTLESTIGSNSGTAPDTVNGNSTSITTSIAGNLTGGTTYTWYVNVTDGTDWANRSYTFTVNNPPVLSNEIPTNQSTGVPMTNTTINCTITDGDSDTMNWTIESTIGSDSSTGNASGTNINADISGNITNGNTYTWYVNVSDGYEYTRVSYQFTTVGANKGIISKGQSAYSLEMNPGGTTLYGYVNSNSVSASIDTNWHYVTLTYDGNDLKLYKDGEEVDSTSLSGAISTNENNLVLGEYMTGTLDELRVSDTARGSAWINTTYQNTNSPNTFATFGTQIGALNAWSYRKKIWINASMINDDLPYFPVLISTTDTDLKNNADTTGNDIIFTNSSVSWSTGTYTDRLPHEIERYTTGTGELVAWVNITSLSSTTNTSIYMYYGSSICTTDRTNANGVWDSNYVMVQHLNETSDPHEDSTSYNNDGNESGGVNQSADEEKIDGCDWFDGGGDFVDIWDASSLDMGTGDFSLEAWVKTTSANTDVITKYQFAGLPSVGYSLNIQNGNISARLDNDTAGVGTLIGPSDTIVNDNNWHYLVATFDRSANGILYVDGALDNTTDISSESNSITNDLNLTIASDQSIPTFLQGTIDEVRISSSVRNSSWINTTYNSTNDPSNFLAFGEQEIQNVAPTQSSPSPSDGATGQSLNPTLQITVGDNNADAMDVTFRTNATGTWGDIDTNSSVYNGTYSQTNSSMDSYNTTYWWSVNVTDGTLWSNQTYSFTTETQNLTLTIRPNAQGWSNQLSQYPEDGPTLHWAKVDEVTQNGDTDYVYIQNKEVYFNDTYNLTDHSTETGTINNITIYLCSRHIGLAGGVVENKMKPVIYTNNQYYDSDTAVATTTSYVTSSWNHNTNPITSVNWTWSEIDNLEVGVALIGSQAGYTNCTQVYVEVNYSSASPFIYTFKDYKFTKLSDFIPGAISPEKEYTQYIDITEKTDVINGKVLLKITEELDETTYLDRIYLRVDSEQIVEIESIKSTTSILKPLTEQFFTSKINKQLLKHSDNNYLILKEGDTYILEFNLPYNHDKIEFAAEGYYIEHSTQKSDK